MHHPNHTLARKTTPGRKQNKATSPKQRSFSTRSQFQTKRFIVNRDLRTIMRLFMLWSIAIIIFALGLSSILKSHFPGTPRQNLSTQQTNNSVPATPVPPSAIFRVDGINITNTQWHYAVESAFKARASSGHYLGGNQIDNIAINTQAIHIIVDPIAKQEVIKELRLTTNIDILYQQWFNNASPQEQQAAKNYRGNVSYKQQMAQEQLEKNIVNRFTPLLSASAHDVYTYYLQHPAQFAQTAPQMHVQQIEVSSPQAAQQVVDQLNRGVSFSKVEATYDISGPFYRAQEGDLGWITVGGSGYPLEWGAQVLSLKAGQVGGPFQIDGIYYIVKCLEGPDYEPWSFSQMQDQAKHNLIIGQLNSALAHILFKKENSMHVNLLDPVYSALLPQFEAALKG